MNFEDALASVWRQVLVEDVNLVELEGRRYPVRRTQRRRLRQVDFEVDGEALRGIEQNPSTASRWAEMALAGQKVIQFAQGGRFIGNVADGKVTLYHRAAGTLKKAATAREGASN